MPESAEAWVDLLERILPSRGDGEGSMAQFDLPLDELRAYKPDLAVPDDLWTFWERTLAEARATELVVTGTPVDTGLKLVSTFDIGFSGFGGTTVKGWLHLPAGATGPLPAVVEFVGYGGGRGLAHERLLWAAPGFMTRGILAPDDYYYRRVFVDGMRAVETVRRHPAVDPARVAVTGGSQGGGISIAVAALVPDIAAAMPDVAFLSDFPRAITLKDNDPYGEIARYLKAHRDQVDAVHRTLSYFDVAVLGRRATAPALFSVGLMDEITPPSTVYAAFNHYGGPKEIVEYPFNDHEGGQGFHDIAKMRWLAERLRG
jgi:cephalosporin-C deacetylase